jgi:aminoglycoside phosphotransferase (APT) family kinase protein
MVEPGPLIAEGRDSRIFDAGPGLVLRRARSGRSLEAEARVMGFAYDAGLPVPRVVESAGADIVMERLAGPTMLDAVAARPWTLFGQARALADLHAAVHGVAAPAWLAPAKTGHGDRLVHLDLHPLNVIVTARGPVLIDWSNAGAGNATDDVAVTWLLLAAGRVGGSRVDRALARVGRGLLVRRFLAAAGRPGAASLAAALAWKAADPNMSAAEVAAMRAVARAG